MRTFKRKHSVHFNDGQVEMESMKQDDNLELAIYYTAYVIAVSSMGSLCV